MVPDGFLIVVQPRAEQVSEIWSQGNNSAYWFNFRIRLLNVMVPAVLS